MMKRITAIVMLMSQFLFAADQISWQDLQKNIDSWASGPVSLVMTDEEKNVWKKLKTPEERMQFIKIFWGRRDPILRTRENEFKVEFYNRVDYADKNYTSGSTPGWKTSQGQVYVVFGPPSRVDQQTYPGSSRPAQIWVYDKLLGKHIPANEALLFVYKDFKYVLEPPAAMPGDTIGQEQRNIDSKFRYQDIPSTIQQAFVETTKADIIDPDKNYNKLLASVSSTEKFGVSEIQFETQVDASRPPKVTVSILPENIPVYDDGEKVFAELYYRQELKKGDTVIASHEQVQSYSWDPTSFADLKSLVQPLSPLNAPAGTYDLYVTVGDRISSVEETHKIEVTY